MKKIKDKTIIVICSICMALICCFGISYKMAKKTYASDLTPITDKQRLGAFLSSLAFSCGVKVYITSVATYEWLVDNFNYVMLRLQFQMSANDVYQNALDNFDNENKTYTLDPEFTNAVQEYLKYLKSEGINEYSGTVEIGSYTETTVGTYYTVPSNTVNVSASYIYSGNHQNLVFETSTEVKAVQMRWSSGNPQQKVFLVSTSPYNYGTTFYTDQQVNDNSPMPMNNTARTFSYNGNTYYVQIVEFNNYNYTNITFNSTIPLISSVSGTDNQKRKAIDYCYGSDAIDGGTTTYSVGGEPNRYWAETEITLDRDAEYTVDYSETDGAEETSTLDELIQLINDLIDTGTEEEQETIPQVEVQVYTPTIDPTTIDIPTLFDGLPEIIAPECVGLGPCLLSGVQSVSQHLQSIYNSNSSVANYTLVSLAVGLALYILTGGI